MWCAVRCHRPRLSLHGLSTYVSKDERTKKNSSEAYLGFPTDDPAFEPCFGWVADVASGRLAPGQFEETAIWLASGPRRLPSWRGIFAGHSGGGSRSYRIKRTPNVPETTSAAIENAPRTHGLQYFFFQTPRFSTSQAVQSKNTYRWTVLTHWLLHLRVFYHFSRRYWPMDCCFFTGSRFTEGGYKALKSRVVHIKYEKKRGYIVVDLGTNIHTTVN